MAVIVSKYTPAGFGYNADIGYDVDPDVREQAAAQRYNADKGLEQARIGIQPAMQAAADKQDRFNNVFPWLQGQLGSLVGGGLASAGGQSGPSPEISVGGVWNPQQTQQQVNAARAKNDQAAATQNRTDTNRLSAQGFGANSPLLQSLYGQTGAQNRATNAETERGLRTGMAKENAQSLLETQTARENQFGNRMKEDIARRAPVWQAFGSLVNSLTGLV